MIESREQIQRKVVQLAFKNAARGGGRSHSTTSRRMQA
jgi:hypothetical protein